MDIELVRRRLARSRARARELVELGLVVVDGHVAAKPSTPVTQGSTLTLAAAAHDRQHAQAWVGRGALKLLAALDAWPDLAARIPGSRALDVGASTGGFSQVLLRHGAAQVVALDVGHGQLAPEVAADSRVEEVSGTSIRGLESGQLGAAFDVVVADLSFISLTLVLDALAAQLHADGDAVVLVKPQFEVGRDHLGSSGVVSSPHLRRDALARVLAVAASHGLHPHGLAHSPILGGAGNAEILVWFRTQPSDTMTKAAVTDLVATLTTHRDASAGQARTLSEGGS